MKKLFYFTQPGCEPCEKFNPIMDSISEVIPTEKINTDYEADRTKNAGINSVPTLVLAEVINGQGRELKRYSGVMTYQQVQNFYNS